MNDNLRVNKLSKQRFFGSIARFEEKGGKIGSNAITSSDRAMWKGFIAGLNTDERTLNPHPVGSFLWEKWEEGYAIGLED